MFQAYYCWYELVVEATTVIMTIKTNYIVTKYTLGIENISQHPILSLRIHCERSSGSYQRRTKRVDSADTDRYGAWAETASSERLLVTAIVGTKSGRGRYRRVERALTCEGN